MRSRSESWGWSGIIPGICTLPKFLFAPELLCFGSRRGGGREGENPGFSKLGGREVCLCPVANPRRLKSLPQPGHKVGMDPIFPKFPATAEGLFLVWEMNPTILPSSQVIPTHLIPHLTPPHGIFSLCPSLKVSLVISMKDFCGLSRFSWISPRKVQMMLPNLSIQAPPLLFLQSQKSTAGKVPTTFPSSLFMEWQ